MVEFWSDPPAPPTPVVRRAAVAGLDLDVGDGAEVIEVGDPAPRAAAGAGTAVAGVKEQSRLAALAGERLGDGDVRDRAADRAGGIRAVRAAAGKDFQLVCGLNDDVVDASLGSGFRGRPGVSVKVF